MSSVLSTRPRCPVKTRLSLSGTLVVARDIAHAKLKERLDAGEGLPQYMLDHAVYYAGPAKTPEGMASGSFGPTTAGRMDSYVDAFQAAGGSMVSGHGAVCASTLLAKWSSSCLHRTHLALLVYRSCLRKATARRQLQMRVRPTAASTWARLGDRPPSLQKIASKRWRCASCLPLSPPP